MEYFVEEINRSVELDNELANLFLQVDEPSDSLFLIQIYGATPDASELTDEELSELCNSALLKELQMYALLPRIMKELPRIKEKLSVPCPVSVSIKED